MTLPTRDEVLTLDWSKDGMPWCKVAARTDIDLLGMEWTKDGLPWVIGLETSSCYSITANSGSVVLTGAVTSLFYDRKIIVGPGEIVLTGVVIRGKWGFDLTPETGSGGIAKLQKGWDIYNCPSAKS